MQDILQQGIAAARAGRRDQARQLLMQVVEADERSEQGWLWLSGVMDDPEDIRTCLENVLELNPGNKQARQGLEWLTARYGPAPEDPPGIEALPPQPMTGPTTRLSDAEPASEPYAAPISEPIRVATAPAPHSSGLPEKLMQAVQAEPVEPENPCPYCGAPTTLTQERCLRCRKSLMVRDQPRAQRSLPLTILGILWYIGGGFIILACIGIFFTAVQIYQAGSSSIAIINATIGFLILLFGGFYIWIAGGLMRRVRWAYYITIGLAVIGLIGTLLQIGDISTEAIVQSVSARNPGQPVDPGFVAMAGQIVWGVMICSLILQGLYLLLIALSYRDFFGPMRRFSPTVRALDHATNYNNGVAYKDRGMWFLASREWEMALAKAPRDLNYLHALGLAYAQLQHFDKARSILDKALELAPGHMQIRESRQLVETMAAKR